MAESAHRTVDADNLTRVFKAYDVRGTVPDQVDEELARAVGSAFVQVTGSAGGAVVVEQVAELLGIDAEQVDPRYDSGDDD